LTRAAFGWDVRKFEDEGKFAIVDAFTGGVGEAAKRERYVVRSVDDVGELLDIIRQAISARSWRRNSEELKRL